jgi:hypothetical protein
MRRAGGAASIAFQVISASVIRAIVYRSARANPWRRRDHSTILYSHGGMRSTP